MKNKKGFTLIELLAVIVILAIIMVIAIPQILNAIENSRKSAAVSSALMYIRAIDYNNKFADMKPTEYTKITSGDVSGINVSIKGEGPTSGSVTINESGKVSSASLCIQGYTVNYNGTSATIGSKCAEYTVYAPGDEVYFDPVTENKCDSTTFSVTNINNNASTCYKWRVITVGDKASKNTITLQLDHNLVKTAWVTEADYTRVCPSCSWPTNTRFYTKFGPATALNNLASATSLWTRVPSLNYSYDTSTAYKNYGELICTNGICKITGDGQNVVSDVIIAGTSEIPVRARLITADEVRDLTMNAGATEDSLAGTWTLTSYTTNGCNYNTYYFSNSNYLIGTCTAVSGNTGSTELSWLVENTRTDSTTKSGATNNNYGSAVDSYWTLTPAPGGSNSEHGMYVARVQRAGTIVGRVSAYFDTTNGNDTGARPVITISKSMIN